MPNELNKLFAGLTQGLGSLGMGIIKKNQQDELQGLYDSLLKRGKDLLNPTPIRNTGINESGQINPPQQAPIDYNNVLQSMYEGTGQLMQYGDEGKQYAGQLQNFYKDMTPVAPKKEIREGSDGKMYDVSGDKPVLYGDFTKPEKPPTTKDWDIFENEDGTPYWGERVFKNGEWIIEKRSELDKGEREEYDAKEFRRDKTYNVKPGSLRKGRGPGSLKTPPISYGLRDDKSDFDKLEYFNERAWSGEKLEGEDLKNYKALQSKLGSKYNLDFEELAKVAEKLQNATTPKEQNKIMQDLQKGDYHNADENTSQAQIDYDAGRINEWVDYMQQIYDSEGYGDNWNREKVNFKNELKSYFDRGSITLREYKGYLESYK